jgi:glycosyltransferase 2 family protein
MPQFIIRVWRYLIPLLLLGLAVHLMLPQLTTLERMSQVIKHMILWAVAIALAVQVLSYLGNGYLLKAIVALVGQVMTILSSTLIVTAAASIGLVAGGLFGTAAATYRWVHSRGVSTEGAILAGWLPTMFNNIALILVSFVGMLYLLIIHRLPIWLGISFCIIMTIFSLIIGLFIWGIHNRLKITRLLIWIANFWASFRHRPFDPSRINVTMKQLFGAYEVLKVGGWRGPSLGAFLNIAFDMLTLYFLFIAAGHTVGPGVLLLGYGLPQLLGKVTFLPGGVGIVEGSMAAMYDSLGVPDPISVTVILSYRVISFWMPTAIGFLIIPYLK